jgi:hypothetical protein
LARTRRQTSDGDTAAPAEAETTAAGGQGNFGARRRHGLRFWSCHRGRVRVCRRDPRSRRGGGRRRSDLQPRFQRLEPIDQIAHRLQRFGHAQVYRRHLEDQPWGLRLGRFVDRARPAIEKHAQQARWRPPRQPARLLQLVGGGVDQIGGVGDPAHDLEVAQEAQIRARQLPEVNAAVGGSRQHPQGRPGIAIQNRARKLHQHAPVGNSQHLGDDVA